MNDPSTYEQRAVREIREWKDPSPGWLGRGLRLLDMPGRKLHDLARRMPGFDAAVEQVFGRLVGALNDFAHWSVRMDRVFEEYRRAGHDVQEPGDIQKLDLAVPDEMTAGLKRKYMALGGAEGAATGVVGLAGLPADIVALVGLGQRVAAEYAAYYGFDVTLPEERLLAMHVLTMASSPTKEERSGELDRLEQIVSELAHERVMQRIEQGMVMRVVRSASRSLAGRLTRAKAVQILPVVGLGVGAGFNAYYMGELCETARQVYRERFLAAKYGPEFAGVNPGRREGSWADDENV